MTVRVSYNGPSIEGDPREQEDLPVDVQALLDLAADPRIDMTAERDAVVLGEQAAYWTD